MLDTTLAVFGEGLVFFDKKKPSPRTAFFILRNVGFTFRVY
jgi:hypothetical protein